MEFVKSLPAEGESGRDSMGDCVADSSLTWKILALPFPFLVELGELSSQSPA